MIVSSAIRTAAHANHPLRVRHLVIALADRAGNLVGHGPSDNHNVGLSWRSAEDDTQAVLVVTGHGEVHHFDCAAG
jgi:hypothetical protein